MARTQAIYVEQRRTWGDTGPLVDNLKVADPISAVDFIIEADNGATTNLDQELHDDIDDVELIDGTDRIYSMSLKNGIVQQAFETGRYPNHILTEAAAGVQQQSCRAYFGRYLGDPDYWLDPGMFRNLQYRVNGDLTISATIGFATGTRRLTIIAHTLQGSPGGRAGFFSTKRIKQFTSLASGDERSTLPDDFPLRYLGIAAEELGVAFDTDITTLKLTQGKDKFIHFNFPARNWRDFLEDWRGLMEISGRMLRADAATPSGHMAYTRYAHVTPLADFNVGGVEAITADRLTLGLYLLSATPTIAKDTTARALNYNVRGVMPHFGGLWPFGDPNDPNSWLKGDDLRNLELVLTQGGAGATVDLWVQQVRP